MSLILEALRKSEAERQRGAAPDLFTVTVHGGAAVQRARAPNVMWWLLLVPALALVVWALTHRISDAQPAPHLERGDAASEPGSVAPSPPTASAVATAPPAGPQAPSSAVPGASLPATETGTASTRHDEMISSSRTGDAPDGSLRVSHAMSTTTAANPALTHIPLPPPMPLDADARAPAPQPAPRVADGLALSDLGNAEREQLPPLKMSMHLWAPEPDRRFVILDGNRVGEGDRVGNAVVEAITADGAVIAWQGRRIVLPMR